MADITADYLRSVLHYDPETGMFTWLERPREHFKNRQVYAAWHTRYCGKPAGTLVNCYLRIAVDGKIYAAHRLAWFYMMGELPEVDLDHVNLNKADNRFINLRPANDSQNQANTPITARNNSGVKCTTWREDIRKWQVQIRADGKRHYIGCFSTIEAAAAAYQQAATKLHGDFARLA